MFAVICISIFIKNRYYKKFHSIANRYVLDKKHRLLFESKNKSHKIRLSYFTKKTSFGKYPKGSRLVARFESLTAYICETFLLIIPGTARHMWPRGVCVYVISPRRENRLKGRDDEEEEAHRNWKERIREKEREQVYKQEPNRPVWVNRSNRMFACESLCNRMGGSLGTVSNLR